MSGDGVRYSQGGFTYIGVLIGVAILGAALAATADIWHTTMQREREKELIFIGNEFRKAIASYYSPKAATCAKVQGRYPVTLESLVTDDRSPGACHHLRRMYIDPMTGKAEWGLVKLPDGQITGVYSLSEEEPLKQAGFRLRDVALEGKTKYSEWLFVYTPKTAVARTGRTTTVNTTPTPPASQ